MLSYQHIYHAGGPADVIKHMFLVAVLQRLAEKASPIAYFETHAGRGAYPLNAPEMEKTEEYKQGIGKVILKSAVAPQEAKAYLATLPQKTSDMYVGSPLLAAGVLRPGDVLHVFEKHPTEVSQLRQAVKTDARIRVYAADGHAGVPAMLPLRMPDGNPQRTCVLIDPSYEVKAEYADTVNTVAAILAKTPKAVVMVWYPLLAAGAHVALTDQLAALGHPSTWQAEVTWAAKTEVKGAYGTGLVVVNLPYQLQHTLVNLAHWACPLLSVTDNAAVKDGFRVQPQ